MSFLSFYERYKLLFRLMLGGLVLLGILIMSTMMETYKKEAKDQRPQTKQAQPDTGVHDNISETLGKKRKTQPKNTSPELTVIGDLPTSEKPPADSEQPPAPESSEEK